MREVDRLYTPGLLVQSRQLDPRCIPICARMDRSPRGEYWFESAFRCDFRNRGSIGLGFMVFVSSILMKFWADRHACTQTTISLIPLLRGRAMGIHYHATLLACVLPKRTRRWFTLSVILNTSTYSANRARSHY